MATNRAAAALGRRGGKAGTGEAKRRGNADHYRALVTGRWAEWRRARIAEVGQCEGGCTLWRCGREKDHAGPCAP